MRIKPESYRWARQSLVWLGDSDLFASPVDLLILHQVSDSALAGIASRELESFSPGMARRVSVPKDELSCMNAAQLDPLDSLIITALFHEYGHVLESRRQAKGKRNIFSHRFAPDDTGRLYDETLDWEDLFWQSCHERSRSFKFAVVLDIADFYNQISHDALQHQMADAGLPDQAVSWVMNLCSSVSGNPSRGVPAGPHASHLLAEAALCPMDDGLVARGIVYCRYRDDVVLFADSLAEARSLIPEYADMLNTLLKLSLQGNKTEVLDSDDFGRRCLGLLESSPITDNEKQIVARWFLRRIGKMGHANDDGAGAVSELCRYFVSVRHVARMNWEQIGKDLMKFLEHEVVRSNEYYQLSILSVLAAHPESMDISAILSLYRASSPTIRREIILCASRYGAVDWIRKVTEEFDSMDPWNRRAVLCAVTSLPQRERRSFLKHAQPRDLLEEILIDWAGKSF
jgi:hypothetical protein